MDPAPGRLGLADIVAEAFTVYRRAPLAWLAITLVSFLVMFASQWALSDRFDLPSEPSDEQIRRAAPAVGAVLASAVVLGVFTHVALVQGAARVLSGHELSVAGAYLTGLRRFVPAFASLLVLGFVSGFALAIAALIPPALLVVFPFAVFIAVNWSMAIPVIVVERARPLRALRRSRDIVRGSWWRTLGITLAVLALGLLPGIVFGQIAVASGEAWAIALGGALGGSVAAPFDSIAHTLLYADLRARKGEQPFSTPAEALP